MPAQATPAPQPAWDFFSHYANRCAAMESAIAALPAGTTSTVVLLGDSISEGHAVKAIGGLPVVNMGISGDKIDMDTTSGGVRRRVHIVAKARPAHVFVMIGVNDFWHTPPKPVEQAEKDYARMATDLKAAVPGARIHLLSTFPTGGEHARLLPQIQRLNQRVREIARMTGLDFVDMTPILAGPDGRMKPELTTDGIHLSPAGYTAWTAELERIVSAPAPR